MAAVFMLGSLLPPNVFIAFMSRPRVPKLDSMGVLHMKTAAYVQSVADYI